MELKQWVGGSAASPSAGTTIAATDRVGITGRYAIDIMLGVASGTVSNVGACFVRNENQLPDRKFAPIGNKATQEMTRYPTLYADLEAEQKVGVFALGSDSGTYSVSIVLHLVEERRS